MTVSDVAADGRHVANLFTGEPTAHFRKHPAGETVHQCRTVKRFKVSACANMNPCVIFPQIIETKLAHIDKKIESEVFFDDKIRASGDQFPFAGLFSQ